MANILNGGSKRRWRRGAMVGWIAVAALVTLPLALLFVVAATD